MGKRAVFSLKTMQFHDFVSIVVDASCLKFKNNIQNLLPLHRGVFLGNCWQKSSGGKDFCKTLLVGVQKVTTELSLPVGRARQMVFFVSKGTKNMPLMLLDRKTKDGKRRWFQKTTRWTRRRDDELAVFWTPIATSSAFPESPAQYFSTKF